MEESGAGPSPTEDGGAVGLERRPALFDALLITPRRRPGQVAHRRRQAAQDRPLRHAIPSQLRDVVDSLGLTPPLSPNPAGIDPGMVARFVRGERDLRIETVDRIAAARGLRLVEVGRSKGRTPG